MSSKSISARHDIPVHSAYTLRPETDKTQRTERAFTSQGNVKIDLKHSGRYNHFLQFELLYNI